MNLEEVADASRTPAERFDRPQPRNLPGKMLCPASLSVQTLARRRFNRHQQQPLTKDSHTFAEHTPSTPLLISIYSTPP
jgi:hypothetical protein